MIKLFIALLIISMIPVTAIGQGNASKPLSGSFDISSLKKQIPDVKSDKEKLSIYLRISRCYLDSSKPNVDSARVFLELAGTLAKKTGDQNGFQQCLILMSSAELNGLDTSPPIMPQLERMKRFLSLATDTTRLRLVLSIAASYWNPFDKNINYPHVQKLDSVLKYSTMAFALSRRYLRTDKEAEATDLITSVSRCLILKKKYTESDKIINDLLSANKTMSLYSKMKVQMLFGFKFFCQGDLATSIQFYHEAERLIPNPDPDFLQGTLKKQLAHVYGLAGENEKAYEAFKLVADHSYKYPSLKSDGWRIVFYVVEQMNVAKRYNEALAYTNQALTNYTLDTSYPVKRSDDSLYYYMCFGQIYDRTNDYLSAEKYYEKAKKLRNVHFQSASGKFNGELVAFYMRFKKYDSAAVFIAKIRKTKKTSKTLAEATLQGFEFKIDSSKGNYLSALKHLLLARHISDSIYRDSRISEYRNLEARYNTEKKESQLLLKEKDIQVLTQESQLLSQRASLSEQQTNLQNIRLREAELFSQNSAAALKLKEKDIAFMKQQSDLQKIRLERQAFVRNIIIVLVILLSIIIALLYRQYRQRKISNEIVLEKNSLLEQLVVEKSWLLKEVHHRVKNNLQTVLSLLESQGSNLTNDALSAIQDSQNRVYAMSLIHQKLYQSEESTSVNMENYLKELVYHIRACFSQNRHITFHLMIEPVVLDVSQAIPIGLIVNEAITNSFKYAFINNLSNKVTVTMQNTSADKISLTISDNGVGMKEPAIPSKNSAGLGLKLMRGLSNDLEGQFSVESDQNGTFIRVTFLQTIPLNKGLVEIDSSVYR